MVLFFKVLLNRFSYKTAAKLSYADECIFKLCMNSEVRKFWKTEMLPTLEDFKTKLHIKISIRIKVIKQFTSIPIQIEF